MSKVECGELTAVGDLPMWLDEFPHWARGTHTHMGFYFDHHEKVATSSSQVKVKLARYRSQGKVERNK